MKYIRTKDGCIIDNVTKIEKHNEDDYWYQQKGKNMTAYGKDTGIPMTLSI